LEPLVEVLGNMEQRFKNFVAVVGNRIAGWKNRRKWQKISREICMIGN